MNRVEKRLKISSPLFQGGTPNVAYRIDISPYERLDMAAQYASDKAHINLCLGELQIARIFKSDRQPSAGRKKYRLTQKELRR
jgi:hypothetical protein